MSVEAQYKNVNLCTKGFWPELGLPSQRQMLSYQTKSILAKMFTEKNESKCKVPPATTLQKERLVKITMYVGLDIIIKLNFTTDFDRCAILNVLNYLNKNFQSW